MSSYIHGGHIRGRVGVQRTPSGPRYWMEVHNLSTGEQVASDDGWADRDDALRDTGRVVAAARIAWSYGFGKKRLNR